MTLSIESGTNRQPRNTSGHNQFVCARDHVQLLLPDIVPARIEKVAVVEEAHHPNSAG